MKPYMSPPLWTGLGFLGGWLYAKPNVALVVVWAAANLVMIAWIMRDAMTVPPAKDRIP